MQSKADELSCFSSMQATVLLETARRKPFSTPINEEKVKEVINLHWKMDLIIVHS